MAWYTMNDIARMTGLTTRTLRSYLRMGLLTGEKVDGVWRFTEEELGAFMDNPGVQQGLHTKRNSLVNDFLLMDTKKENHTCVILDFCMEWEDAKRVVAFFCDRIKEQGEEELRFGMERRKKNVRLILSGPEAAIKEIMKRYYEEN
ncbi:MAG: MerR family transcriptional regulator [Lachnospiraceae bacterium]|nr:MerR family transcriptional regulator [Lachnospiraceae bacterium]